MVLQVLHTLLVTRHGKGQDGEGEVVLKSFLQSEGAWRSFQSKSHQQVHVFQVLLSHLFFAESTLSPETFALLYWAFPTEMVPLLVRWMQLSFPDPLPYIDTVLFHTAPFPPPLHEIGLPLWQLHNGTHKTVFQAYVCGTIDTLRNPCGKSVHFPLQYLKPSLASFGHIESFWFDLTQWACQHPKNFLSQDFFSRNPEWVHAPDFLFVLLHQMYNE